MTNQERIHYFATREEWRQWLLDNFTIAKEIWFVFPLKSANKQAIIYNDAVEEALCFGWIDSTVKAFDSQHQIQRFTPRKAKSPYSQPNKERLRWLLAHHKIHATLLAEVQKIVAEPFHYPSDIIDKLQSDEIAWHNYQRFSDAYKRIRIAYIDSARKRPEEFEKRLHHFCNKTRDNKLIAGFGGIDKYY